jgi:RNA polymerase sigma factor (sigma-70 family)
MSTNQTLTTEGVELVSTLFNKYRKNVFSYHCSRVKDDRDLADELTQQTFIKVAFAISLGKYENRGKPLSWIIMLARNVLMDHFRGIQKRRTQKLDSAEHLLKDPRLDWVSARSNIEISENLKELIELLPEEQKYILTERIFYGTPFKEIARNTGTGINTLLGRMRYAFVNMRKLIKQKGFDISGFNPPG